MNSIGPFFRLAVVGVDNCVVGDLVEEASNPGGKVVSSERFAGSVERVRYAVNECRERRIVKQRVERVEWRRRRGGM